ncbi:MAG: hypothetical protein NT157_02870 [Candidatus Micrarchaeota archaeon]|nr:hypothetical protein [Candidatus Micrarchaeota archaeon]
MFDHGDSRSTEQSPSPPTSYSVREMGRRYADKPIPPKGGLRYSLDEQVSLHKKYLQLKKRQQSAYLKQILNPGSSSPDSQMKPADMLSNKSNVVARFITNVLFESDQSFFLDYQKTSATSRISLFFYLVSSTLKQNPEFLDYLFRCCTFTHPKVDNKELDDTLYNRFYDFLETLRQIAKKPEYPMETLRQIAEEPDYSAPHHPKIDREKKVYRAIAKFSKSYKCGLNPKKRAVNPKQKAAVLGLATFFITQLVPTNIGIEKAPDQIYPKEEIRQHRFEPQLTKSNIAFSRTNPLVETKSKQPNRQPAATPISLDTPNAKTFNPDSMKAVFDRKAEAYRERQHYREFKRKAGGRVLLH